MAKIGDRISLDAKKVGQPRRTGVIAKITKGLTGERFEIRWDDETTSIIAPSAGTLLIEGPAKKGGKTKSKPQVKSKKANGKKSKR